MSTGSCSIDNTGCNSINNDGNINYEKHWCNAYTKVDIETLGWYEKESKPSLELIIKSGVSKDARILNVGAGATTLIDNLIDAGYTQLIANDISHCALGNIEARISKEVSKVEFITDDIVNPKLLDKIEKVDLWNDRAVLHFFNERRDIDAYFNLLKEKVNVEGYVILSEFNLEGAEKCSGLPVKRYDAKLLAKELGEQFELLESFNHNYIMPSGDSRAYVYTLFKRKK